MLNASAVRIICLVTTLATAAAAQDTTMSRTDRWREDVRFLARTLPASHKNAYAHVSKDDFARAAAALDSNVPALSDTQVQLRVVRLAAMLHDGHTTAPTPTYATRLPIALLWTDAGPHIVAATDEYASLIGRRIVRVNGHDIREVADTLRAYVTHENEIGFQSRATSLLVRPAALRDIGFGSDTTATILELAQGNTVAPATVRAVPANGFVAPQRGPIPLYRQRPREKYWWTYVPDDRLLFIKYNQCRDADDFRRMTDSVARALDEQRPLRVVVDLRDNSGGDSRVLRPLVDALRARSWINRKEALFVIIGRATFSSGLLAAVELRNRTQATLVGEPTGERPNHFGELKSFTLPNSKLEITYSTKFFEVVSGNPDALTPSVLVPPTAEAYVNGEDVALRWILSRPAAAGAQESAARESINLRETARR